MKQLWTAVASYYENSAKAAALKAALTGGLHNTESTQEVTFPYATFQLISDVPDHWASADYFIENCLLQFNIFSKTRSMSQLLTLYDLLKAAFDNIDNEDMTIVSYRLIQVVRQNSIVAGRIEGVWQANVTYRLLLEPA